MRPTTLCFTVFHYPETATAPDAYLERVPLYRDLPRALTQRGYSIHVVHLFPTAHTFNRDGVHYHFVCSGRWARRFAASIAQATGRPSIPYEVALPGIQTIRTLQPDLIHFHGTNLYLNHFLLLAALGRKRPPIVVHYHGGFPSPNRLVRRVQRFNLRRAARFLFTTKAHAQPFIDAGLIDQPQRVVAFMETSSAFRMHGRAEARRHTGMTGDPVCLWAGRLDPLKDPMTALRGFEQICAARPQAHLYLYYLTDALLPDLQRYVAVRPRLQQRVHFRGRAPFEQMERIYNSADFLLQASHREFSGCAVLEAMACGVIPAVTDIPSFRAMTDAGRHGILFPPGDAEALARGVLAVPSEEIAARSKQVRAWFEHAFSFPALARQLDTLYGEVLGEG